MALNFENTEIAFRSKSDVELKKAQLLFSSMSIPWLTKMGITLTQWAFRFHVPVHGLIKRTIFTQFCGGETLQEADATSAHMAPYGVGVIMDYGVEGKSDETEFDKTTYTFLQTIRFVADKPNIPFVSMKLTGFARFELLEKLHRRDTLTEAEQAEAHRIRERVDKICKAAADAGKMILIDAEDSWIQQPVDDLADEMMARYNKEQVVVFNTFQLYRHDRLDFLKNSYDKALQQNYHLGAKLVRGAYMEKERKRARDLHYEDPIQPNKEACDRDFDAAIEFCLNHLDRLVLFIGTHNETSCLFAAEQMAQKGIPNNTPHVHFSQLYGMSDNISFNLARDQYRVSKYLPYGPVGDVIPYLMRRAQENTSVAGQTGRELRLLHKESLRRKALQQTA